MKNEKEPTFDYGENIKEPEPTKGEVAASKAIEKLKEKKEEPAFVTYLNKSREGLGKALANRIDTDLFLRIATTGIKTNPELMKCDIQSILGAIFTAAQLGLEPLTPLGECYIIPYKNKATIQLGYRGVLKLIWQSGFIESINLGVVKEKDEFKFELGTNQFIKHIPFLTGEAGEPYAYYVVVKTIGGGQVIRVKSKDEIIKHRNKFSYKNVYGKFHKSWEESFDEMALKTVLLSVSKQLPKRTTPEALLFERGINQHNHIIESSETKITDTTDFTSTFAEFEEIEEING
jgi:recombination protein RecT